MGTAVSSKSCAEPLGLWVGTRMPVVPFGPVALLLTGAAAAAGAPRATWAFGACAIALLLVFQFRLWDDLADAPRDRIAHPERVLPRCESTIVFRLAVCAALAVNAAALAFLSGIGSTLGLVALTAGYGVWYSRPSGERTGLAAAHALVVKYPVFAWLLAPGPVDPVRAVLSCATVYLAFSAYELAHDPAHREKPLARMLFRAELAALTVTFVALIVVLAREASP
jgi:hypothetical protein